jgi:hypothetical protein
MSKYKLIKIYPGSPELGTIITATNGYFTTFKYAHLYPEFWEEIVEPTFEILSFRSNKEWKNGHLVHFKQTHFEERIKDYLKDSEWDIHSVKRLSDGEIFTIGDTTDEGIIEEFQYCKDHRLIISFVDGIPRYLDAKGSSHKLSKIKKQKLFTTEDNVDIFKDDTYYNVYNYKICNELTAVNPLTHHEKHVFSTKDAAQEWIILNKPCLSINDIKSISTENIIIGKDETKNTMYYYLCQLKGLVKSKL